ncbi:MAG: hypothetical protein ACREER_03735 [Alphaproteobacteria bacterium]
MKVLVVVDHPRGIRPPTRSPRPSRPRSKRPATRSNGPTSAGDELLHGSLEGDAERAAILARAAELGHTFAARFG